MELIMLPFSREALLKRKEKYSWSPCTNLFRSATFHTETIFFLFYKSTYVIEEVNRTDPSPLQGFPAFRLNRWGEPFVYILSFYLLLPPRSPIKATQFNVYGFELKNGFEIFHYFNFFYFTFKCHNSCDQFCWIPCGNCQKWKPKYISNICRKFHKKFLPFILF